MSARADATAENTRRILDAAYAFFSERLYDQVALEDVAARAGVGLQTVIRRFRTKEGLIDAVAESVGERVERERFVPTDDIATAVRVLVDHYERDGDSVLRLLSQEERVAPFRHAADRGRASHRAWVEHAFGTLLAGLPRAERRRRQAQLVALCDVYVWKLLRRDQGLGRRQTEQAIIEMIEALIGARP